MIWSVRRRSGVRPLGGRLERCGEPGPLSFAPASRKTRRLPACRDPRWRHAGDPLSPRPSESFFRATRPARAPRTCRSAIAAIPRKRARSHPGSGRPGLRPGILERPRQRKEAIRKAEHPASRHGGHRLELDSRLRRNDPVRIDRAEVRFRQREVLPAGKRSDGIISAALVLQERTGDTRREIGKLQRSPIAGGSGFPSASSSAASAAASAGHG